MCGTILTRLFLYISLAAIVIGQTVTEAQTCAPRTLASPNVKDIIIGSCAIYQQSINPEPFCPPNKYRNCTEVWEAFSRASSYQPACNVSIAGFSEYIKLTSHDVPRHKYLFWSHVYTLAMRFSGAGKRYFTVADTLPGFAANEAVWCSQTEPPGMSAPGTLCPVSPDPVSHCNQTAVRAFWLAVSVNFGRSASGDVTILLNGTASPIISKDSIFRQYEIESWQPGQVTSATVLLINERPDIVKSRCAEASVQELYSFLKLRGIAYKCIENREDVVMMFCLDNPAAPVCRRLFDEPGNTKAKQIGFIIQRLVG